MEIYVISTRYNITIIISRSHGKHFVGSCVIYDFDHQILSSPKLFFRDSLPHSSVRYSIG